MFVRRECASVYLDIRERTANKRLVVLTATRPRDGATAMVMTASATARVDMVVLIVPYFLLVVQIIVMVVVHVVVVNRMVVVLKQVLKHQKDVIARMVIVELHVKSKHVQLESSNHTMLFFLTRRMLVLVMSRSHLLLLLLLLL